MLASDELSMESPSGIAAYHNTIQSTLMLQCLLSTTLPATGASGFVVFPIRLLSLSDHE